MAGATPNDLYQVFLEAAGQQTAELTDARYALEQVISEMNVAQQQAAQDSVIAARAQTQSGSGSGSGSGGSGSGSSDSTLTTVLKSGLGVAPLIGGLISLFGGGSDDPPPLVKYAMPAALNFDASESGGQLSLTNYDQMGMARTSAGAGTAGGTQAGGGGGTQVTVNVQAMDAQSLMERSGDIAAAVREAMLNLNSINDVVSDL